MSEFAYRLSSKRVVKFPVVAEVDCLTLEDNTPTTDMVALAARDAVVVRSCAVSIPDMSAMTYHDMVEILARLVYLRSGRVLSPDELLAIRDVVSGS